MNTNYDSFIQKLISGTKSNKIKWIRCKSNRFDNYYPAYETKKGEKILVLQKLQISEMNAYGEAIDSITSELDICANNYEVLSEIYESDLQNDSNLLRLYRIVERQANHIDDILGDFVEGIDDIVF